MLGVAALSQTARAVEQCLVIGDSLTKEYEIEFPALYPRNQDAWDARNWIEILHEQRHTWFDLGGFGAFPDYRITGHKYNWAFPGAQSGEIRGKLTSSSWLDKFWQNELKSEIRGEAERAVIFAGGNDASSNYGKIYNGSSPTAFINATRDNLIRIVDWVRAVRPSVKIVLAAVPHVGCAPDVQRKYPTDPVKTARVTAALASLNTQLASLAKSRGIGFSDGVFDFTRDLIAKPLVIDGVEIQRKADADCRPTYAFSGDGFHPNTPLQAKIAQIIAGTFRAKWPSPAIPVLTDPEIRVKVLGL